MFQLRASATFADGSTGDCTQASTWTSADDSVARVSTTKPGEVTSTGGGSTKIAAKCGPFSAEFPVTILGVVAASASLAENHPPQLVIGERVTVRASAAFSDGTSEQCAAASWTSSNPSTVTVSADGTATAVAAGSSTITSTCRFATSSVDLVVRPGLRIRGLENQPFVLLVHPRMTIYTDLLDERGQPAENCTATFTSSDPSVLTVISNGSGGTIVPTQLGESTITASCGVNAANVKVRVARYNVVGTVRGSSGELVAGAKAQATYQAESSADIWKSEVFTGSDGKYNLPMDVSPAEITISASGYLSKRLPVATWTRQPTMASVDAELTAVPSNGGGPGVRISGFEDYPDFVISSPNIYMHAALVDGNGTVTRDCTGEAVWATSDASIARPGFYTPSLGKFFVVSSEGDVLISATCAGFTGYQHVRIAHYTLSGTVRSSAGAPVANALVSGVPTSSNGSYSINLGSREPTVTVTRVGFEPLSVSLQWNGQTAMFRDFVLSPLPGLFAQGEGTLCRTAGSSCDAAGGRVQDVINFTVPRNGTLHLSTYWQAAGGSGIDNDLFVDLTCNGARVYSFPLYVSSGEGGGFNTSATTSCQYQVTISNRTTKAVLPYAWSLNVR